MDRYFSWLKDKVTDKHMAVVGRSYDRLFYKLYTTEFIFVVPFDENRLLDGLSLRREFSTTRVIFPCKCSVFEVLIALALRCEDQIMHDQKHGERSGEWFWEMLGNMVFCISSYIMNTTIRIRSVVRLEAPSILICRSLSFSSKCTFILMMFYQCKKGIIL